MEGLEATLNFEKFKIKLDPFQIKNFNSKLTYFGKIIIAINNKKQWSEELETAGPFMRSKNNKEFIK